MQLSINGVSRDLPDAEVDPDMPLLWALRDVLKLTGTKFGCGVAACGACTVHVDGQPVRSCVMPLGALAGKAVRLSAWVDLHFQHTPQLVGMLVRVQFLKPDGSPKYKLPLWLFWTGPTDVPLADLAQMYQMRFTIEHFFRFLKQRLGLLAYHTTDVDAQSRWTWVVLLAYWQLLLARHQVKARYHPWDPARHQEQPSPLTPGQVLDAWAAFSAGLETPAAPPRPSGKAPGRPRGFRPKPRTEYPVVVKGQAKSPSDGKTGAKAAPKT